MFKLSKSQDEGHRESSLDIFSHLASHIGDKLKPYFGVLKDVLAAGLQDSSLKVKIAALSAAANFLQVVEEPQERSAFQQLTPLMLHVISASLNAQNEEEARVALEVFVDLAEVDPVFLKPNLQAIIPAMVQIATSTALEDGICLFLSLSNIFRYEAPCS
jgi:hypothetical protein